jgi:AcrR family transcriptional regulator
MVPSTATAGAPDKRAAVLAAALSLFCERSFDGTPMPLVAERAGVGAGTIYRYFPSKRALGNAVFRAAKRELKRTLTDALPRELPAREAFHFLWSRLFGFATANPEAFRLLETHHHADYLDAESRAMAAELDAAIAGWVASAQRAGAVRDGEPVALIALAFGAFVGLAKSANEGRLSLSDPRLRELSEDAVWSLLRAPGSNPKETRT